MSPAEVEIATHGYEITQRFARKKVGEKPGRIKKRGTLNSAVDDKTFHR